MQGLLALRGGTPGGVPGTTEPQPLIERLLLPPPGPRPRGQTEARARRTRGLGLGWGGGGGSMRRILDSTQAPSSLSLGVRLLPLARILFPPRHPPPALDPNGPPIILGSPTPSLGTRRYPRTPGATHEEKRLTWNRICPPCRVGEGG